MNLKVNGRSVPVPYPYNIAAYICLAPVFVVFAVAFVLCIIPLALGIGIALLGAQRKGLL